ncbi:MUM1 protein, partial [Alectura lathami]|nr:MUM1 protein [Alectura lathami]
MAEQEYILCSWKMRLWPAKVLPRAGVAVEPSAPDADETLEVEILGLKEKASVQQAQTVPLTEAQIEEIASNLDGRVDSSKAVEELTYRCALKTALDFLKEKASAGQALPSEEGPRAQLSQADDKGSLTSSPIPHCRSPAHLKEELGSETPRRKRGRKKSPNPKPSAKNQRNELYLIVEMNSNEDETQPSEFDTGDLHGQCCTMPEPQPLPGQRKVKPRSLEKTQTENKLPLKPKEGKTKQGRRRPGAAGSPVSAGNNFPTDQAQPPPEDAPQPKACKAGRASTRPQPKRMSLDSSCQNPSDLDKSTGRESTDLASDELPSQLKEEENKDTSSPVAVNKPDFRLKDFHLSDLEEEEGLEHSELSSKRAFPENLSALLEEEDDDEEFPSVLSHQEPEPIEEGTLVWCKWKRYPYWPAVVKSVKRKLRKAYVLFIEGNTDGKKKSRTTELPLFPVFLSSSSFSVSLKSLKHFDCEEKQELIAQAKKEHCKDIEWCIELISDYRIRVGCRSFTGSFLEYFADDISSPVRKLYHQGAGQMASAEATGEEDSGEPLSAFPQKPSKRLLPDRTRAARDKANKKLVEFIVKSKGAEEHLVAILKCRKQSRWMKGFLNPRQHGNCIETYLEDEEQLDLVVDYLKEVVYHETDAENRPHGDAVRFILDVLLPEAIIYAISAVDDIDYKKAEEKYMRGPSVSKREREEFEDILERKRLQAEQDSADS